MKQIITTFATVMLFLVLMRFTIQQSLTLIVTLILFLMLIGVTLEAFFRARDKDNENHPG